MAPQQHWGDLLPLPLPERRTELPGRSRASKRRLHRQRILDHEMGDTVIALNHLAGFSQAHRSSLNLIRDAHRARQWPRGESLGPRAALDKLLRRSASYGAAVGPCPLTSQVVFRCRGTSEKRVLLRRFWLSRRPFRSIILRNA